MDKSFLLSKKNHFPPGKTSPTSDKSNSRHPLPKTLLGVVLPQRVRCGKPRCRCASGNLEDLHGPYYYRFWRQDGKLRKQYLRKADAELVRAACMQRQIEERRRREERDRANELIQEQLAIIRELVNEGLLVKTGRNAWTGAPTML